MCTSVASCFARVVEPHTQYCYFVYFSTFLRCVCLFIKRCSLCVLFPSVRSFGTEDRQVPKPIPPRTETYEFIIFRGSDIKDLHVSEIPPKTDDAPQDPAIVSAVSAMGLKCVFQQM